MKQLSLTVDLDICINFKYYCDKHFTNASELLRVVLDEGVIVAKAMKFKPKMQRKLMREDLKDRMEQRYFLKNAKFRIIMFACLNVRVNTFKLNYVKQMIEEEYMRYELLDDDIKKEITKKDLRELKRLGMRHVIMGYVKDFESVPDKELTKDIRCNLQLDHKKGQPRKEKLFG